MLSVAKWLLLAAGFGVLVWTFRAVGWDSLYGNLRLIGPAWTWILAVYGLVYALNTAGWECAFPRRVRVPFLDLLRIRIIGESLNSALPMAASLGGEPVKAALLDARHRVPASEGYAASLIVHTTLWASLNLFVLGGVAAARASMPLTPVLGKAVLLFLAILGAGGAFLFWGLHAGVFMAAYRVGERFGWWGSSGEAKLARYAALDESIRAFYRENRARFLLSTAFNFAAWLATALEIWLVARALGLPLGFEACWLIQALIQVVRMVTFFVPASVGAQEGGIVFVFSQFGLPLPAGLALAVVLRAREFVWVGIGLALWAFLGERRARTQ